MAETQSEKELLDLLSECEPALIEAVRSGRFAIAIVSRQEDELKVWVKSEKFKRSDARLFSGKVAELLGVEAKMRLPPL